MKRRKFLAASALFSLLASTPAWAANKAAAKKPLPARTAAAKTGGRNAYKPVGRGVAARPGAVARPAAPPIETPARAALTLPEEPPALWRTYEVSSSITLSKVRGRSRVWLPLAQYKDSTWQRSLGHRWEGNFETAGIYRDPTAEMEVFVAEWKEGVAAPQLRLVSQVATQDRHFDVTHRNFVAERTDVLRRCLQPFAGGAEDSLRRIAERILGRIKDPVAQGKAIYDWVVDNTARDPLTPGSGRGDIAAMLESGHLAGKSADIALLFVALCRTVGLPARPVFGLRVDGSRLFTSLGASGELAQAQHCRAEFYAPGYGWIPVDPSDVRTAILEEHLGPADAKLTVLRKLLFGFWEMNWIGFNAAQDVSLRDAFGGTPLPQSAGGNLPFLVYPQAESADGRFSSLDRDRLAYSVTARRVNG
ncbi:transglutaminase domain-containing protein [Rhodocyclus tenuis]|uniref:Transglutaminase n=2 Tax=Rhodocyclus TaxID=1064 RepID=A0A6L5JWN5_RHOTE|nr:transglutaminase-like domain-containing protein [Rhodocyclus gracilis]MQY51212.1 transglutaminase [Rhodocyclus gracilis]NJA89895.1 transglutaminase domain-containing protein [Rhodocyclus gracilis]